MSLPTALAPLDALRAALPAEGLFAEKEWHFSPHPFVLPKKLADELAPLGYRLSLFQNACNDLYALSVAGKQPPWIAELLDRGKPEELIALARQKPFRSHVPRILRPDLILTEDGFVMSELDSIPGGIGLTGWLSSTYAQFGFPVLGGADGMWTGFSQIAPEADILVSQEAATYRPEMQWLAAKTGQRVCDAEGYGSRPDKHARVYRFFELFDLPNIPDVAQLQADSLQGSIEVTPPWKPFLEEKLWLALFWMRPLREYWRRALSERHFLALQKIIPRTWVLDPQPLPPHAEIPGLDIQDFRQLGDFSQKQRDLVIKASGFSEVAWGARSVVIGSDEPQASWQKALEDALAAFPTQPYVLQRFHKARIFDHAIYDAEGRIIPFPSKVRLCPYYFCTGKSPVLGGALATCCPPDKKILHGMRSAALVPVVSAESETGPVATPSGPFEPKT
ncbi:MAG: hypothetical protein RLZZ399_447 [Verrucomicrobiota bacterium]|jgi:hypothetical protein